MKRKIYEQLLRWKNESAPETALLIEGARRVGKSWIVEEFAKCEYRSFVLIDFNKVSKAVIDVFKNDLEDLDVFFRKLSEYYGVRLYEGETLFVFDEVQEFPRARAAIKYLVEDGRYHFIETGSLMSIAENVTGIVIPSEEDSIKMYPLDFEEFLWATGRADMVETIKSHRRDLAPFGAVHRKMIEAFREYLVVGGMPQAVSCWAETHDLKKVEAAKKRILKLYRNDIRKHAGRYAMKAEAVFDEIPAQLQEHDKKFRLSVIGADARMREYGDAFLWLKDAMIVNVAYNSTEPTVGLKLSAEYSTLKCYMADTGLLISHAFGSNPKALEEIVRRVMFDSISINEGMLIENAVAQMLVSQGVELFFYARYDKKDAKNRMEIDFLLPDAQITRKKHVSAVEVKSENDYTTSSLDKFRRKFGQSISAAYVAHPGDIRQKDGIIYMPIYMTPWLTGVSPA